MSYLCKFSTAYPKRRDLGSLSLLNYWNDTRKTTPPHVAFSKLGHQGGRHDQLQYPTGTSAGQSCGLTNTHNKLRTQQKLFPDEALPARKGGWRNASLAIPAGRLRWGVLQLQGLGDKNIRHRNDQRKQKKPEFLTKPQRDSRCHRKQELQA